MRAALIVSLATLAVIGCRPLDAGAPLANDGARADTGARHPGYRVGTLRVIDGDTFVAEGETIRIANIDAPELSPRSQCLAEASLAEVAKRQLDGLLGASWSGSGSGVLPTIERDGQDRYGRTLARVVGADGKDVGEEMILKGAAVRWTGRRAEWCVT